MLARVEFRPFLPICCDKCIAELTDKFVPADDAQEICVKVLKCKNTAPTVAPTAAPTKAVTPTTAAPTAPAAASQTASAYASKTVTMLRAQLAGGAQCNCNCNGQDYFASVSSCQQCSIGFCQANFCQGASAIAVACAGSA